MYLKIADITLSGLGRRCPAAMFAKSLGSSAHPAAKSSLAHNLAALHIVTVLIGFTLCSVLLYFKLVNQLDQSAASELKSEIVSVKTLLSAPNGLELLKKEIVAQHLEGESHGIQLRILDPAGNLVAESPGMTQWLPVAAFPAASDGEARKHRVEGGTLYLVKNAALGDAGSGTGGWRLQVGMAIARNERLAVSYRNYLLLFALSGLCFALVTSVFVVQRGLKPLSELSGALDSVSDCRLGTRLEPAAYPSEMQPLVASFNGMMGCLQSSFDRLSHYSGNLAHELRTPINSLMLQAELALSGERSARELREMIGSSLDEYQRLSNTVDRLLFLARAERTDDLALQRLDVAAEAGEVLDYFSEEAAASGVKMISDADAVICADPTLFRRALSNLVSNALAHTAAGGQVSVSARRGDDGGVDVMVCDTGCGIDAEHLPLLFDRFYRVKGESADTRAGTGLGLAIVKAIMEMHGGEAQVWSERGKGTIVTLHFSVV